MVEKRFKEELSECFECAIGRLEEHADKHIQQTSHIEHRYYCAFDGCTACPSLVGLEMMDCRAIEAPYKQEAPPSSIIFIP
jgi:hypothetical protein